MPGAVQDAIGGPAVTLSLTMGGVTTVVTSADLGPVTIVRGRTDPDQRPQAATMTVTVKRSALPALPDLGDGCVLNLTPAAEAYFGVAYYGWAKRRFGGKVSDAVLVQGSGGAGSTVRLVAVGQLADIEGRTLPSATIAAGRDDQQAAAILGLLGVSIGSIPGADAPSVFNLRALDASDGKTDARAALDAMSDATGGELWEDRRQGVFWLTTGYRLQSFGAYPSLVLTAAEVTAPLTWTKTKAGMVNDLDIGYGPEPQARYTLRDEWSAGKYGTAKAPATATRLATYADARRRGVDLVGRRGRPAWRAGSLTIDVIRAAGATTKTNLMQNDIGQLVHLSGIPQDGPYAAAHVWREGDVETITADSWTIQLNVTDYGSIGTGPRWMDLGPEPAYTTGLTGWWKADSLALADGAAIGQWNDSTLAGNHAVQAVAAAKPTFVAAQLGALPVVRFDGGDSLASPLAATGKPFSLVALVKPTSFAAMRTILGASGNGGEQVRVKTDGRPELLKQFTVSIGTATNPLTAATWAIVAVTYSATGTWAHTKDGAANGTGVNDQAFTASTTLIGAGAAGESFLGDMAELLKYDHVLSAAELRTVGEYLKDKWLTPITSGLAWTWATIPDQAMSWIGLRGVYTGS